jgi:DNA-binding SARP family transcriptional activator
MIELRVLGTLDLRDPDNGDLGFVLTRPKLVALLTYLAIARPKGFHHRDRLVGLFWPESGQTRARRALNQALYELRKALGEGVVASRGDEEVGLAPDRFSCDADAFERACNEGELEAALELYGGDLLTGFALSDSPEFEAWLDERREGLRHHALGAVRKRSEELAAKGERVEATFWLRRALRWEPYDETILRELLEQLCALGDRTGALREHAAFGKRLKDELGVETEAETRVLVAAIEASRESAVQDREMVRERVVSLPSEGKAGHRIRAHHRAMFVVGALAMAIFVAVTSYRAIDGGDMKVENGRGKTPAWISGSSRSTAIWSRRRS